MELLNTLQNKRSLLIWDYFVRVDKTGAVCNTCQRELKMHTSSNLTKHLMRKHKSVYAEYREEIEFVAEGFLANGCFFCNIFMARKQNNHCFPRPFAIDSNSCTGRGGCRN